MLCIVMLFVSKLNYHVLVLMHTGTALCWDQKLCPHVILITRCAADGSFLRSFLADSANMDPDERGRFLEEPPEGAPDIDKAHEVRFPSMFTLIHQTTHTHHTLLQRTLQHV